MKVRFDNLKIKCEREFKINLDLIEFNKSNFKKCFTKETKEKLIYIYIAD